MKKNVAIIGGGSSAHVLIPLLSKSNYSVNLLTRKPESWSKNLKLEYQSETGEVKEVFEGTLNRVSNRPEIILTDADFVILCLPVSAYKTVLNKIAPYLNKDKKLYLGTIYGQGGFNWMVEEIKRKYDLYNIITFAVGLIPWICRIKAYGKMGITYGPKAKNVVAISPNTAFDTIKDTFLTDICYKWFGKGAFYQSSNFISLTLSVDNQIIHPARMYGLYLKSPDGWNTREEVPFFYRDFDDLSAGLLKSLDDDYSRIREKIRKNNPTSDFKYMLDYLSLERFSYDSCNDDIKTSFTSSKTLRLIETPVVKNEMNRWVLNKDHRFFMDDIFYGLCIAKGFAEHFSITVPTIDEILNWAQQMLEMPLIKNENLNKDCTLNGIEVGTYDKYDISSVGEAQLNAPILM